MTFAEIESERGGHCTVAMPAGGDRSIQPLSCPDTDESPAQYIQRVEHIARRGGCVRGGGQGGLGE